MKYLLIFDMKDNGAGRRRVNRYLKQNGRMEQHSVWSFNDMLSLLYAAKLVKSSGGKAIAFMSSDQILLDPSEIGYRLGCRK